MSKLSLLRFTEGLRALYLRLVLHFLEDKMATTSLGLHGPSMAELIRIMSAMTMEDAETTMLLNIFTPSGFIRVIAVEGRLSIGEFKQDADSDWNAGCE